MRSYYDRTSEIAQLNLYNPNTAMTNNAGTMNFIVPDNTVLIATLNTNLSTRTVREGDRFVMTVRSPSNYADAIIEGYVSSVERSGRVAGRSEMTLNYETIRLPNNQTYRFAGTTESVKTNGENVRVNREGGVGEGDRQTRRTVTRTAITAGIGALIGAIAGGGAGAGCVCVQGRDDLKLRSGAEITFRASAPRSTGFASTTR